MSDVFGIVFQGLSIGIGVLVGGYLGANEFEKAKLFDGRTIYEAHDEITVLYG